MRLGTKFSVTTVVIVVVVSMLLEVISLAVFSRKTNSLNKELFVEKLDHLVSMAYQQDELFFEGVYRDMKEGQQRVMSHLDILYRNRKDPITFPFIVDTRGKMIVHPAESRWNKGFERQWKKGDPFFDEGQVALMLKQKEGAFQSNADGMQRWYVFKTYEPWNWIFCMTTSMYLLNQTAASFIYAAIFISAAALILSVFVVLAVSRRYTQPILLVIERLQQIAKGEIAPGQEKITNAAADDEVEMLAHAVHEMAGDLQRTTVSRDALLKEIEERKRLEQVLLQSEKMAAIGQLAGGVAHEINNPLGVILGFSQNVVKRIKPGDPLELPLKSIEREALRCKNLVQDLLTFSRAGKPEKEPVDLKEAMEGALSLVLAQSKVKNVELSKEFSEVPRVMANKDQIQQVIVNLSNNAIDAMPAGGKLIFRMQKTTLENKDAVEIQVQDTGEGIPQEIQSKIFNPFFTTKEIGKGTGLGLSLVYEIIQKHSGRILLESEMGKGTTFKVFLPLTS